MSTESEIFDAATKLAWQAPKLEDLGTGIGDVAVGMNAANDGMAESAS